MEKKTFREFFLPVVFCTLLYPPPYAHVLTMILSIRYHGREAMCEYDLFAVINHEGQIDNGHYTNFARFNDEVCRDTFFLLFSSFFYFVIILIKPAY